MKLMFITMKSHHVGETFMFGSYFFLGPVVASTLFNSRLATAPEQEPHT